MAFLQTKTQASAATVTKYSAKTVMMLPVTVRPFVAAPRMLARGLSSAVAAASPLSRSSGVLTTSALPTSSELVGSNKNALASVAGAFAVAAMLLVAPMQAHAVVPANPPDVQRAGGPQANGQASGLLSTANQQPGAPKSNEQQPGSYTRDNATVGTITPTSNEDTQQDSAENLVKRLDPSQSIVEVFAPSPSALAPSAGKEFPTSKAGSKTVEKGNDFKDKVAAFFGVRN